MNKTISDEQIIAALLASNTRIEAAAKLEISIDTLYKRMKNETFKSRFNRAKSMVIDDAVNALQNRMNDAISTITDVMKDTNVSPQIRINAADTIIRYSLKMTEINEITKRIEALENKRY